LKVLIGTDGNIEELHVENGHPLLINLAMDAVRQWRCRPYEVNGTPFKVETMVDVKYELSKGTN
jgi:protein TonB